MIIHTDRIAGLDIDRATADLDGVHVEYSRHGSRSRARKFDITLTAEPRKGRRTRNSGSYGAVRGEAAATWDEWGVFLARLFAVDPEAFVPNVYESKEHFHWSTGGRFAYPDDRLTDMHDQHRWSYTDSPDAGQYHVHECACGAVRRHGRMPKPVEA